jgi:hypothetical protein
MKAKQKEVSRYYQQDSEELNAFFNSPDHFDFNEFDSLRKFDGTHPQVMLERIAKQNWQVELDISKRKFSLKDRLLFWIETQTGKRLFSFKNYRIV